MFRLISPVLLVVLLALSASAQPARTLSDSLMAGITFLTQQKEAEDRTPLDSLARTQRDLRVEELFQWADARPLKGVLNGDHWLLLGDLMAWLSVFEQRYAYDRAVNAYKHAAAQPGYEYAGAQRLLTSYEKVGFAPGVLTTGERLIELDKTRAVEDRVAYSLAVAHYKLGDKEQATRWAKQHLKEYPGDEDGLALRQRIRKELP
jgi:tetratricopeptide (TPR) repeat protein